ncbi:ribosomal protein L28e [Schizopora paradoxa]|uniref:Ribosomal protein L28e n=1 Tax=Schizopora paradoxa TaxID=27342 RepID=A0A0H2SSK9_9AGAM|nr:ribosomal protein L28e [Schizopora paradoxa]
MSADLQWLLVRNSNAFMVKRVREGPIFSKEPGNPMNIHSYKYSGLVNTKTIDVQESPSGIQVTTKTTKASPHAVKGSKRTSSIRNNSGSRRSFGIASSHAKRGYRSDLRKAVIARVSALQEARSVKKPQPEKKVRGKKAKAASA